MGRSRQGLALFSQHCAGCHQIAAEGGYLTGAVAPPLTDATATQVAEAVRIGPYLMPRFSSRAISDRQLDSIVAYVEQAQHPADPGGWSIGRVGPVPGGAGRLVRRRRGPDRALPRGGREAASMRRLKDALFAGLMLASASAAESRPSRPTRSCRPARPTARAERSCSPCLRWRAPARSAFVVVYAVDPLSHRTQFLGLSLGLALASLAAALLVVGHRLVVTEELEEPYPDPDEHEDERAAVEQIVVRERQPLHAPAPAQAGGAGAGGHARRSRCSRRSSRSARSSRPAPFTETPWRRGRRLVDEDGRPLRADDIEEGTFYTAFPEGADRESSRAPLVVVRLDPAQLRLPPGREGWAPRGILAYSKICTHAGCAIALYRKPTLPARRAGRRRSSARATTRPSTRRPAAPCSSARPAGRCRSCR